MKSASKMFAGLFLTGIFFLQSQAQEVAVLSPASMPTEKVAKGDPSTPAVPSASVEMTITLKNSAERPVIFFAGPKEEVRKPKVQTIGGLGKNTLYVQSNDVVCLLSNDVKAFACANVKPGTTSVEINVSATNISSK